MRNEELLKAFARYLDAALNVNLGAQIEDILSIPQATSQKHGAVLHRHRNARQAFGLRLRPDAFFDPERTKQKTLAVVKSYAAGHALEGMTRKDYCSLYPERSFERAALGAFFGFLRILKATR